MIIAVCDPKGIAIEAIKTILYHDKGLSDRISRIYEFWNKNAKAGYLCKGVGVDLLHGNMQL